MSPVSSAPHATARVPEPTAGDAAASAPGRAAREGHAVPWGREVLLLLGIALVLAGADQWTKGWAIERLGPLWQDSRGRMHPPPGTEPVTLIPGAFQAEITGNRGAIFGLGRNLSERWKRPLFIGLSLLAMTFIVLMVAGSGPDQRLRRIGLAAVLSGAIGNLVDRIRLDYVVDFLDWYWGVNWPTFNVADAAITVGVGLVMIDLFIHPDAPAG